MNRRNLQTLAVAGVASLLAATGFAGGGEVYCNGGNTVIEAWRNVPAGGIPWTINAGPFGTRFGPNSEITGCVGLSFPGAQTAEYPMVQSMVRAAEAWANATDPVTGAAMSSIQLDSSPGLAPWQYSLPGFGIPSFVLQLDSTNMVTLWEPESTFNLLGGPAVVAVTLVDLNVATGDILEADIAFNALSNDSSGRPFWTFIEENALTGNINATATDEFFLNGWQDPIFGYADLEGIAVHEMGHFLGLGHSLVEGPASRIAGTCPSMFETGHTETFVDTVTYQDPQTSDCGNLVSSPVDAADTPVGGLLGKNARDLQADDRTAIGALYPSPSFGSQLGSIRGQVLDPDSNGLAGVHLMAIGKDFPNGNRVGTIAFDDGVYSLDGLSPGAYYVLVESIDKGGFFNAFTVPNYVDNSSSSCVPNVPTIQAELWDAGEDWFGENGPMVVGEVMVAAGTATTGIDLKVISGAADVLTVRDQNASPSTASSRGIRLAPGPTVDPNVVVRVDENPSMAGQLVYLVVVPERSNLIFNGELSQLSPTSAFPIFPLIEVRALDQVGDAEFVFEIPDTAAHFGLALQAYSTRPNSTLKISNTVSIFVDQP